MKIIHYSLGMHPERAGGLCRYSTDLMLEQSKKHSVFLLYPNGWDPFSKKIKIRKGKMQRGIQCYRLYNTVPIPLLYGIKNGVPFTNRRVDVDDITRFVDEVKPDILHIHTLMGLTYEFVHCFKTLGVKVVYTTHDYFGICPKVNLIDDKDDICNGPHVEKCVRCCKKAPSSLYLRFRMSNLALIIWKGMNKKLKHIINY